ncbi:MAG: hypothetical protein ACR2J8_09075 [Thermomicrobiales bacterium]
MIDRLFDRLAGLLVARSGRRRLVVTAGAAMAAPLLARPLASAQSALSTCQMDGNCNIHGVTGGGVVEIESGPCTILLFASHFANSHETPAFGKFTWRDPQWENGLVLESVGSIIYPHIDAQEYIRELRGQVRVNGERDEPFSLVVSNDTETARVFDRCHLLVGDSVSGGTSGGWGYSATGKLIGGELVLIKTDQDQ